MHSVLRNDLSLSLPSNVDLSSSNFLLAIEAGRVPFPGVFSVLWRHHSSRFRRMSHSHGENDRVPGDNGTRTKVQDTVLRNFL